MINRIIRFTAKWCAPCRAFAPIFDNVSKKFDNIEFLVYDVDDTEDELISKYQIRSIPTVVFEDKDGNPLKKIIGATSEAELVQLIEDTNNG